MRLIDQQYQQKPCYGVYRMWEWLQKDKGCKVNIQASTCKWFQTMR